MNTIAMDFDGVIHRYSKGYHDGSAYDIPMPGAEGAIYALQNAGHPIVVMTCRDLHEVRIWMRQHLPNIPTRIMDITEQYWTSRLTVGLSNRKVHAAVYVDDKAIRFTDWKKMMFDIPVAVAQTRGT